MSKSSDVAGGPLARRGGLSTNRQLIVVVSYPPVQISVTLKPYQYQGRSDDGSSSTDAVPVATEERARLTLSTDADPGSGMLAQPGPGGRIAPVVGIFLELLAGIPSVIIGLWGGFTFGPLIAHRVAPIIASITGHLPTIPPFNFLRGPTSDGQGLLTGGLVIVLSRRHAE